MSGGGFSVASPNPIGGSSPGVAAPADWALDPNLLLPGVSFKEAKQKVLDLFESKYLAALLERNKGNVTRSAHEAGLTRYHLRELLKRHGLTNK
jgi:DNA-binding NtrC family response regulator